MIEELEQMRFEKHCRKTKEKMTTKSTADRIRVEELAFPFSYTNYLGVAQPESDRDRLI